MSIVGEHFSFLFPHQVIAALHQIEKKRFYLFQVNIKATRKNTRIKFYEYSMPPVSFFFPQKIFYHIFIDYYTECFSSELQTARKARN